jgi:hypothetical protein
VVAIKRKAIPAEFTVSSKFIGWAIGAVAGLLGALVAWNQVWDRFETHWRLEKTQSIQDAKVAADIQAVKDKTEADVKAVKEKTDADIKAAKEKAESDTKRLAQRAEQGRAWLFWSITDSKAQSADQWATVCASMKLPAETCLKFKETAKKLETEASLAKKDAVDAGKDK